MFKRNGLCEQHWTSQEQVYPAQSQFGKAEFPDNVKSHGNHIPMYLSCVNLPALFKISFVKEFYSVGLAYLYFLNQAGGVCIYIVSVFSGITVCTCCHAMHRFECLWFVLRTMRNHGWATPKHIRDLCEAGADVRTQALEQKSEFNWLLAHLLLTHEGNTTTSGCVKFLSAFLFLSEPCQMSGNDPDPGLHGTLALKRQGHLGNRHFQKFCNLQLNRDLQWN